MLSERASLKRLKLSNFKLNCLLEITQAINENLSTSELLIRYAKILCTDLNLGKVTILSKVYNWEILLEEGFSFPNSNLNQLVCEYLSRYTEIQPLNAVNEETLNSFDIVIPVFHKDRPFAYVLLGDIDEDREGISPTIKHLRFIQTITNIILVAIENKRLYKETLEKEALKKELELASKMQSMLIPSNENLPRTNKINFSAYYNPHSEVGGDYYDVIELNSKEFGFCIADVSGKGISAAILMSNFQANLRALFTSGISLKELIKKLNTTVMRNANGEKFITIFIGKYNVETRILKYINAGHNPPVHHSFNNDTITYLTHGAIGLGMFETIPTIAEGEVLISPGDKILCYTDGLVEAENIYHSEFGTIPIEASLSIEAPMETTIDNLMQNLMQFTQGVPLFDDITIVGIEFQ
ncbi:MAG: PP2C family protein-serine/threonine phosphatase [Bacteroidales bacterium]|nr:PP2C family protein-serine/threonine phosphatase [Bacteroidales bacterium]